MELLFEDLVLQKIMGYAAFYGLSIDNKNSDNLKMVLFAGS